MPDFVHRRLSHLVPLHAALGHGPEQDVAAVLGPGAGGVGNWRGTGGGAGGGGAGALVDDGLRQGAVTEEGLVGGAAGGGGGKVGLEVDVQRGVAAFSQCALHGGGGGVRGPVVVDGVCGFLHVEADVGVFVGRVQHKRLVTGERLTHVRGVLGGLVEGSDEVEIGLDGHVVERRHGTLR